MSAQELSELLQELIGEISYMDSEDLGDAGLQEFEQFVGAHLRSYEEGGYLTRDQGFVIGLDDGSEFHVTIVRSN